MKRFLCLCAVISLCAVSVVGLNVVEEYRDRGAITLRTDMAIQTLNGNAADYANLSAMKQADSSSHVFLNIAKGLIILVTIGGSYCIIASTYCRNNGMETKDGV